MARRTLIVVAAALLGLAAAAPESSAQQAPASEPGVRIRFPTRVRYRPHPALEPGGRFGSRIDPAARSERWAADTRAVLTSVRDALAAHRLMTALGQFGVARIGERRRFAIAAPPEGNQRQTPLGVVAQVAELGIQMRSRVEMRFDRLKNERCTAFEFGSVFSGCEAGFPAPSLEQQFQVAAGGLVSQRVNLNVDFDTEREFDANDDIRVWYQGLDDEILQRVEVGDVRFRTPASRFISSGIGGNSFGFQVEAELGPLELRTVLAQQKGSSVRSRVFTIGDQVTQPVFREIPDLDYEAGRFFTVVDPRNIPGYPDVDLLNLALGALPGGLQVRALRVYRLRALGSQGTGNVETGAIDAIAIRDDSDQRVGPFRWELLTEGSDYYVDPSLLWFGLSGRVGDREFLAVSYVTALGDTVGTFPSVGGEADTLRLIYEPERGLEVPTFYHELRNFYRLGGSDVDRSTVSMTIVVNESDRPLDGVGSYLSRLGMAQANDQNTLDNFNRVFPRERDPNQGAPVRDLFVVFPHLTPFADSTSLQAQERNDSLYLTPTYLRQTQGPPSTLSIRVNFDSQGGASRSSLPLGALAIQPGSERLSIGNRQLTRGVDYEIAYDIGVVTFFNPDSLFPGPAQVRVDFEEAQQFDADAKSLVGFALTYSFGSVGGISAVGLMQNERTQLLRPRLGFEPEAAFVGGISTNLDFRIDDLTRALDRLPFIETQVPSRITFNGELAVSRPNPNRAGVAFVDDFEGSGGAAFAVLLNENLFQLGSRPGSVEGIDSRYLNGGIFADIDAVPLVWQNLIQVGFEALSFTPQDIDSTIVTVGAARETETVLWMTLKPDTVGGAPDPVTGAARWLRNHTPGPRWRSMTQPFGGSGLGIDLSRAEFLEFWVLEDAQRTARANEAALIIDLGSVFEDAVAPAPAEFRVSGSDTTFSGLQFVGTGVLDTERDRTTNAFNAAVDDVGIHEDFLQNITDLGTGGVVNELPLCKTPLAAGVPVFPRGDLGTGCTRGNGLMDTEDLDSDNRLDITVGRSREDVFRYVFPIGSDRHFVREGGSLLDNDGRALQWRLYRIPLRSDSIQAGTPNIRQVRAMRITMVTPDRGGAGEEEIFIALSRMRLVGAPWLKRSGTPIAGIAGLRGEPHGEVVASIVTTENATDLGYTSPPGIRNAANTAGAGLVFGSEQINERSLRLIAVDLRQDERAEAFERFTDNSDKNFLKYNTLRVWARGRGPGWEEGDLEFFIKVGRDENNFYLYRAPARSVDWEPEMVVDLQRWLQLRAELEGRWLSGEDPSGSDQCGGSPTAFVICDGPYVVHIQNPGVAPPNLARVSEVAVGMIRVAQTVAIPEAELWVDDIRLDNVVDDAGYAGAFDARFIAADVGDVSWSYSRRDDQFRQLGQDPTYVGDRVSTVSTSLRVDKFLPASWGMNIPVTARFTTAGSDPFYLNRSDIVAGGIEGLRTPASDTRFYQISVRRERRGTSFLERNLLDPINLFAQFQNSRSTQLLDEAEASSHQLRAQYSRAPEARTVTAVPGFVKRFVQALPGFIKNSEFGRALSGARLRWNPVQYTFSSSIATSESSRRGFRVPVALAEDTLTVAARSLSRLWVNQTAFDLRPFSTLNFRMGYSSTRDLRDYGDSTTIGLLLQRERRSLAGSDVGFERGSNFTTQLDMQPVVASWIRPSITLSSGFQFNRNPNSRTAVRLDGSAGGFELPETISNSRRQEYRSSIDLPLLAGGLFGRSSFVASALSGINTADFSYVVQRRSSFDLFPFEAGTAYRLGFGSLADFLEQDGILATSAQESKEWTASGGANLPLGARVDLAFRETRTRTFSLRSVSHAEVIDRTRDWPSINLSWTYTPVFLRRVLRNISGFASYRHTLSTTLQPPLAGGEGTGIGVERTTGTNALTPSLTFSWAGGIVTSARFSRSVTESEASGSLTRSEQDNWVGSVSFNFRPPRSLVRLSSPLLTRLEYSSFNSNLCLQRADQDECATVNDTSRRSLSLTMDTGFSNTVRGGATFSYVLTEQSVVSSKFSQIIFTVFAQINFFAGQIR